MMYAILHMASIPAMGQLSEAWGQATPLGLVAIAMLFFTGMGTYIIKMAVPRIVAAVERGAEAAHSSNEKLDNVQGRLKIVEELTRNQNDQMTRIITLQEKQTDNEKHLGEILREQHEIVKILLNTGRAAP